MRRALGIVLLAILAIPACRESPPEPPGTAVVPVEPRRLPGIQAVDLFGTRQVTLEKILDEHASAVEELIAARDGEDPERYRDAWMELDRRIREMGAFAVVDFAFISYFGKDTGTYLTIDLVDEGDRERRMPFAPEPAGSFEDPDGLLAAWGEYEQLGWPFLTAGKIQQPVRCPAFHCVFGFDEPELAPYEDRFESGVPANRDRLVQILESDADEGNRATAAFLLAHLDDGEDVVALMLDSFTDGSSVVRNNAMRVVALLAGNHAEIEVPLGPAIRALDYPSTTDRNKAAAIIEARCGRPEYRETILRDAGPRLLEMLALWQPNNHDYAYQILTKVSGESFDKRDHESWAAWLEGATSAVEPGRSRSP
jgi:hypothetical protein